MRRFLFLAAFAACSSPSKLLAPSAHLGILFAQDENKLYWAAWTPGGDTEVFSRPKWGGEPTLVLRAPGKGNGLAILDDEVALSRVTDVHLVTSKGRTIAMPRYLQSTVGVGRDLYVAIDTGYESETFDPSVFRIDGATPTEISGPLLLGEMVVDGPAIFATQCLVAIDNAYDGGIVRFPRAKGAAKHVASGQVKWRGDGTVCPEHLAVDDRDVWFTLGDEVKRVPKTGGTPVTFGTANGAAGIAVDVEHVYVAARDEHAILSFSKSDRSRTVLRSGLEAPVLVLVDSRTVWWLDEKDARIGSFPK